MLNFELKVLSFEFEIREWDERAFLMSSWLTIIAGYQFLHLV